MDAVQQITGDAGRILAKLLFKKEETREVVVERPAAARETGVTLFSLLSEKEFGRAEEILLREMRDNFDFELYNIGLKFFDVLEKMTDAELRGGGFGRGDVDAGREKLFAALLDRCGSK